MAKATHVVTHKKMYIMVKGKMSHVPMGTEIACEGKQAKGYGKKVMKLGKAEALDVTHEPETKS